MCAGLKAACAALVLTATQSAAQEPDRALAPAVRVALAVTDLQGQPIGSPTAGTPFRIDVTFENMAGRDAPRGLDLFAWLRRADGGTTCGEAARAYLATDRSLPVGTIDLSGSVLAVLTGEGAVSLVNPHFQLATANILDAATLPAHVDRILSDPFLARVIAWSSTGGIWAIHAAGGPAALLAEGLVDLEAVYPAPDGRLWIHAGGRFGPLSVLGAEAVGTGLAPSGRRVALWSSDQAAVVDLSSGAETAFTQGGIIAARPMEDAEGRLVGLAALTEAGLSVHWTDAPGVAMRIHIPPGFTRLDLDPAGRLAVLHDPAMNDVALVDLARGTLAQVILSSPPVSEVGFTSRDLFLMASDQSQVATIALSSIEPGRLAAIQETSLGLAAAETTFEPRFLVPLGFEDAMIAVHPGSYAAYQLHGTATTGRAPAMLSGAARGTLPPMFSVTLRGGIPRQVVAVDRGFREIAPGLFRAVVALPDAEGYELVGTTGIGGMSFCAEVTPGTRAPVPPEGQIALVPEGAGWRLRFADEIGRPIAFDGSVLLVGLQGGWRDQVRISTGPDGLTEEVLAVPSNVPVAVIARSADPRPFPALMMKPDR